MLRNTFSGLAASAIVTFALLTGTSQAQEQGRVWKGDGVVVTHPWAPATKEGVEDAPGYLTITNTTSRPDRLVGGSFIEANHIELVSTTGKKPSRVEGITINPGESVTLGPVGPHLMFVGLKGGLDLGTSPQCILVFEQAGRLLVEFDVEGTAKAPAKVSAAKRKHGTEASAGAAHRNGGEPAPAPAPAQ